MINPLRASNHFGVVASAILSLTVLAGLNLVALAEDSPPQKSAHVSVSVDIRPGLCPNHLRIQSPLTIPIAILGTTDFEAARVEPGTIRLSREGVAAGVAPESWDYADVGTPVIGGLCACHKLRGDGLDDLEFEFSIEEIAGTLGLEGQAGQTVALTLSGSLITGEDIEGNDCVHVISGLWPDKELGDEVGMLERPEGGIGSDQFQFAFYTTVSDRITFAIFDLQGRVVAELMDMDMAPGIYNASWDGKSRDGDRAPAGIYFARVTNSWASDTKKIMMPQ